MGRAFEWVQNVLQNEKPKKDSEFEKSNVRIEDLRGDEYLKTIELWKNQIEMGAAGQYGEEYIFTDKDLGIQHMRAGNGVFVTLNKKSSFLNSELFLKTFEDGFEKKEGSENVVFMKTLDGSQNKTAFRKMHFPLGNFPE